MVTQLCDQAIETEARGPFFWTSPVNLRLKPDLHTAGLKRWWLPGSWGSHWPMT
jgi:hypothetical protein